MTREISDEVIQVRTFRAAEHGADEQPVPSQFCHHTHVDRVARVGTANQVLNKVIFALHVRDHVVVKRVKSRLGHFGVVVPPDGVFHAVRFDDMFVFG